MSSARTEYAIVVAIFGILLSIGIPSFGRGQYVTGTVCAGLAILLAAWTFVTLRGSGK